MIINYKYNSLKKLKLSYKNITGKNNLGQITFYHRGGGYKKNYRIIDFKKKFICILGIIKRIEYNPLKKNYLMIINYLNNILTYNNLIKNLKINDFINDFNNIILNGSTYYLKQFPSGSFISLLELYYNSKLKIIRSAGSKAQVLSKSKNLVSIKLPSGKIKKFLNNCKAVSGLIELNYKKYLPKLKAGLNRNNNLKPIVRGVAMNPIDHPHGGGQGKTSGGRKMSTSPWSKYTKGLKSKKKKQKLNYNYK